MVEAMAKFYGNDSFLRDSYHDGDHSYSFENNERLAEFSSYTDSPIRSISGSSSEGSDWANFDEDLNSILSVTDGSVAMLLNDDLVESIGVGELNWSELEPPTDQTASNDSILESTGVSHVSRKPGKRKRSPDYLSSASKWSKLSCEEKHGTIEALTQVISQNMTLKEQMEIISIIDPLHVISPNDTEFAIDLESLDDSKLQIIKDIVMRKSAIMSSSRSLNTLPSPSDHHKCSSRPDITSKIESDKKQDFKKRAYLEEIELRQRKLQKQSKKEKRSGLFLHEKKIKRLNTSPEEEDDYVNILD